MVSIDLEKAIEDSSVMMARLEDGLKYRNKFMILGALRCYSVLYEKVLMKEGKDYEIVGNITKYFDKKRAELKTMEF